MGNDVKPTAAKSYSFFPYVSCSANAGHLGDVFLISKKKHRYERRIHHKRAPPGSPASLLRQGFAGSLHLSSEAAKLRGRIAGDDNESVKGSGRLFD
jgi:hypothetical protein